MFFLISPRSLFRVGSKCFLRVGLGFVQAWIEFISGWFKVLMRGWLEIIQGLCSLLKFSSWMFMFIYLGLERSISVWFPVSDRYAQAWFRFV